MSQSVGRDAVPRRIRITWSCPVRCCAVVGRGYRLTPVGTSASSITKLYKNIHRISN